MSRLIRFFSSQLLTSATLALVAGIWLARSHCLEQADLFIPTLVLLALALLQGISLLHRPGSWQLFLTLILLLGGGWLHMQYRCQLPAAPSHIYNLIPQPVEAVVTGRLAAMVQKRGDLVSSELDLVSIRFASQPQWQAARGKIGFRLKGQWPAELLPGDQLAIRLKLKRPRPLASPGSFDTAAWLARQDIWVTGFVSSPLQVKKVAVDTPWWQQLLYLPERWRSQLAQHIDRSLAPETAGLYRAILIGDKSALAAETEENFKQAGLAHILVISGIHLTILGGTMFAFFLFLLRRSQWLMLRISIRQLAAVLSLPILILYATLAGLNPPVVRSLLMSLVVLAALCSLRQKSLPPLISGVLLVMLLFNPHQLFEASLQLSFVATIAILWLVSRLSRSWHIAPQQEKSWSQPVRWLLTALAVSTIAAMATAPLSLHYFHRVSLVGPLANLLVEPLICLWSLTLGFLAVLLLPWAESASSLLLEVGSLGLQLAETVARGFAALPFSHRWLAGPGLAGILTSYAGMAVMALACGLHGRLRAGGIAFALVLTVSPFIPGTDRLWHPAPTSDLRLVSLDVGHGSATLLQFAETQAILVDGGGPALATSSVGERIIAPYLWHSGIDRLETVVITHPDGDHYNGLPFIVDHFAIRRLWVSGQQGHSHEYQEMLAQARLKGAEVLTPPPAASISYTEQIELRNVATAELSLSSPGESNSNNLGLVVRVNANGLGTLFPGDIENDREQRLVQEIAEQLPSHVMLAAHHGSKTSNSKELLQAVDPWVLLVSAGAGRDRGFPSPGLIAWSRQQGILLANTGDLGTLELEWRPPELSVWHYCRKNDNPLLPLQRRLLTSRILAPTKE